MGLLADRSGVTSLGDCLQRLAWFLLCDPEEVLDPFESQFPHVQQERIMALMLQVPSGAEAGHLHECPSPHFLSFHIITQV